MHVAVKGVCQGHRCDDCVECQGGYCCGSDVAEVWNRLPKQGSWPDMIGELGIFTLDESGKLQCHVCGRFYDGLSQHVNRAHNLNAEEYRAYFGFSLSAPLISQNLINTMRENGNNASEEHKQAMVLLLDQVRPSREQMSVIAYRRESRAELKPKRNLQLKQISARGLEALAIKRRDPIFSGAIRRKQINARRRHKLYDQRCPYCGFSFCAVRYRGTLPITCRSAECRKAAKRAAQKMSRK